MIDREWLNALEFNSTGGMRVHGLANEGGDNILLLATTPEGRDVVLKVRKHHLGLHIRELPLFLTDNKPLYDVGRLNQKLLRLLGNPFFDGMTCEYDRVYTSVINLLRQLGMTGLTLAAVFEGMRSASLRAVESDEAILFILRTQGMKRRIADWAALPRAYENAAEGILSVNGPNFPFTLPRAELIDWAAEMLKAIDASPDILRPSTLEQNPLYVWGAAVMDGFFTDDELPAVVDFLNEHFGPMRRHPQAVIFLGQARMVAHLLDNYLKESKVERFDRLCSMVGFDLQLLKRKRPASAPDESEQLDEPGLEEDPVVQDAAEPRPEDLGWEFSDPPSRQDFGVLLGFAVAGMHRFGSHGDLHPGNFGFDPQNRKVILYDFARAKILNRPLTAGERVDDLLPLMLHNGRGDWDVIWAGYSAAAPNDGQDVLGLLEARADSLRPH